MKKKITIKTTTGFPVHLHCNFKFNDDDSVNPIFVSLTDDGEEIPIGFYDKYEDEILEELSKFRDEYMRSLQ